MALADQSTASRLPTIDSDSSTSSSADQRLAELFAPCFTLILKLRASNQFGDPEVLRHRIVDLLDRTEREALSAGGAPETIQKAKFAIVAFLDETILSSDWPQKEEWINTPLQLELYDQYDAGEVFFDHLHSFLDSPNAHAEELEVYYLCMALGFKGKYRLHEQEKLRELIERTSQTLSDLRDGTVEELAPHGTPRDQVATEVKSKVPTWVIGAAAVLVGVLLYAGMYLYVSASAREVAGTIQQMGAG